MNKLKIGIKFCGGCNPEIERGEIIRRLKKLISASDINDRVKFDQEGPDMLILTNGCSHACLEEDCPAADRNCEIISIQGNMIDLESMTRKSHEDVLYEKIRVFIE